MSNYLDRTKEQINKTFEQIDKINSAIDEVLGGTIDLRTNSSMSYLRDLTSVKERLVHSNNSMIKEHMLSERHRNPESNASEEQADKSSQNKAVAASRIYYTIEGFSNRLQSFLQTKGMELIETHLAKNDFLKSAGVSKNDLSTTKVFSYSYPIEPYQTPNGNLMKIIADRYVRYVLDGVKEIYMSNDRLRGRRNLYDLIGEIRVYTSTEKIVVEAHEIKITGLEIVIQ